MNADYINELSKRVYQQNKEMGWWDDPDRCIYGTLQLVSTEIAEATEGLRKDLMDDHLPHRKMEEVELADAFIRMVDFGGRYDLEYVLLPVGADMWDCSNFSDHGIHLYLNRHLIILAEFFHHSAERSLLDDAYTEFLQAVIYICESRGYDLKSAIEEKLAYNLTRSDHQRENRAKDDGKKF